MNYWTSVTSSKTSVITEAYMAMMHIFASVRDRYNKRAEKHQQMLEQARLDGKADPIAREQVVRDLRQSGCRNIRDVVAD